MKARYSLVMTKESSPDDHTYTGNASLSSLRWQELGRRWVVEEVVVGMGLLSGFSLACQV